MVASSSECAKRASSAPVFRSGHHLLISVRQCVAAWLRLVKWSNTRLGSKASIFQVQVDDASCHIVAAMLFSRSSSQSSDETASSSAASSSSSASTSRSTPAPSSAPQVNSAEHLAEWQTRGAAGLGVISSLAPECTPLKHKYDACFDLWFRDYLAIGDGQIQDQQRSAPSRASESDIEARKKSIMARYDRDCGALFRDYQACVKVSSCLSCRSFLH